MDILGTVKDMDRREFIVGTGAGVAGIIAAGQAPAAVVRSMLGATETGIASNADGWANPYVTDGLVAMWDGEWNVGFGKHDTTTKVWRDLSGNGNDFVLNEGAYDISDFYLLSYAYDVKTPVGICDLSFSSPSHVEVVAEEEISGRNRVSTCFILGSGYYWGICKGSAYSTRTISPCFGRTKDGVMSYRFPDYKKYAGETYSYNYDELKGYINGVKISFPSDIQIQNIYLSGTPGKGVLGGCKNGASSGYSGYWSGKIYSIRFYSRPLTEEEVFLNHEVDAQRFGL